MIQSKAGHLVAFCVYRQLELDPLAIGSFDKRLSLSFSDNRLTVNLTSIGLSVISFKDVFVQSIFILQSGAVV